MTDRYLKIKDGESIDCVIRGDIRKFQKHFGNTIRECGDGCAICPPAETDYRDDRWPSKRFITNVVRKIEGVLVAQLFENGMKLHDQIEEAKRFQPKLNDMKVNIKREQVNGFATYTLSVIGEIELPILAAVECVELHSIEPWSPQENVVEAAPLIPVVEDECPF